jgi:TMEM175 potassium channel family protein
MERDRLEAFSDGVIAILITIMVLELHIPHGADWKALRSMHSVFLTYALSFVFLGIYWNNHHHMFQLVERINGKVLWANLHLLFWLSIVPFVTNWIGDTHFAPLPAATYGAVLLLSGVAYMILERTLIAIAGPSSELAKAVSKNPKEQLSAALYAVAIPTAFIQPWISGAIYVAVATMWLIPDSRIESRLKS